MSNANTIFAFTDGAVSASTFDGSTWAASSLPSNQSWGFIGGTTGKFIYNAMDTNTPFSTVVYSIIDNITWAGGLLPLTKVTNIAAVTDGSSYVYTSYDGINFS